MILDFTWNEDHCQATFQLDADYYWVPQYKNDRTLFAAHSALYLATGRLTASKRYDGENTVSLTENIAWAMVFNTKAECEAFCKVAPVFVPSPQIRKP